MNGRSPCSLLDVMRITEPCLYVVPWIFTPLQLHNNIHNTMIVSNEQWTHVYVHCIHTVTHTQLSYVHVYTCIHTHTHACTYTCTHLNSSNDSLPDGASPHKERISSTHSFTSVTDPTSMYTYMYRIRTNISLINTTLFLLPTWYDFISWVKEIWHSLAGMCS